MSLGTSNISLSAVKTLLGASNYSLFDIGHDDAGLINKWSRYKPIRDAGAGVNRPAGSNSLYGLNLPTDWTYLTPRGGSPGGSPDEPVRLGDFKGYEHDKANTDPPVYCDDVDSTVTMITPTLTTMNILPWQKEFTFGINTATDSIRIVPADLSLDTYHWGIHLSSPYAIQYYKTLNNLTNNASIMLNCQFTDPSTVDGGFVEFPPESTAGEWTYNLFISSTEHSHEWTTVVGDLGTVIALPVDVDIARLQTTGVFDLDFYIALGTPGSPYVPIYDFPKAGGGFPATGGATTGTEGVNYDTGNIATNCTEQDPIDENHFVVDLNEYDWVNYSIWDADNDNNITSSKDLWMDGCWLRVWCDDNTSTPRDADIYLLGYGGGKHRVDVHQDAAPPTFDIDVAGDVDSVSLLAITGNVHSSTSLYIKVTIQLSGSSPDQVWVVVNRYGPHQINGNTDTWTTCYDNTDIEKTIAIDSHEAFVGGTMYYITYTTIDPVI